MKRGTNICTISVIAFYALSMVLLAIPSTSAATPTITLTPTAQVPGASVSVSGTGFSATKTVGIGFGAESSANDSNIAYNGTGVGPWTGRVSNYPIKPGSFVLTSVVIATGGIAYHYDNGDGTLSSPSQFFASGTINYVTGQWTTIATIDLSSLARVYNATYTRYQYNLTSTAGIITNATGGFTASITIPSAMSNGNYNITAIDVSGNRAASSLSVGASSSGWSKTYGGTNAEGWDNVYPVVLQTSDGGFLLTGSTTSYGAGSNDAYLVKTDANGNLQWNKTYGGPLNESACMVWKTNDGGYAIMCITNSYGAGGNDFWLLKTDANGNLLWNKTYGGTGVDNGYCVFQTADGGYALFGETNSFGAGGYDLWVVKTDATGNMQWNKTYGAAGNDMASNFILAADGGYAMTSWSSSFGGFKALFIKTDSSGNMLWNKTYSLGAVSWACEGIPTADGGYAIVGVTYPTAKRDAWLIKTDSSGNMVWNKTYGGTGDDTGWNLVQMDDGGYAIVGVTSSFGAGGVDGWLLRTDSSGNMLWNRTYGGAGTEFTDCITRTSDGGFVLAGFTDSFGAGSSDLWLVKTDDFGAIPEVLTIGVVMLLSTFAVIVSSCYFRKRPKIEKFSQVKV